ncbi:MAG: hypothetical protein A3F87_03915 [Omnitrophica WOR_2 bacterium RIFCSPLOWO2_12_FULL_51_24]|nr:MAG: hypothetical protein A2879_00965 [Omnitrophica WOR_2 bacterium RIFCSPHIGHO2_01_FULL_49_10]OGX35492.1 MAG: hypothetical protein A3I43_01210 [Omnitrophica WOR_2 bacterium RIFCSPLOWO2_02_FULL_50_19]OGX41540.1 MAG: hypothetical protein A3F87_03915 [Omnitrophica WOR_2 bacterium RIFCSPLOWO2_12_FULL_51_24]
MKISILTVLVLSLVLFSAHILQAAEKSPQKPVISVPKAAKPVKIDGNLDEYPKYAVRMDDKSSERLQYFEYGGKDDISADIYLLWDYENLYVAAKVTDDAPFDNSKEGPDIWDGDALEVLLGMDGTADPGRIYFGKGDYQIGLSPGNNKNIKPSEWVWRRDDYKDGIEVAAKPREKGYIIEAKIPFKVLGGFKPEAGKKFDFDIAVDDSDKGKRDAQMAWTGTKEFYSDPSQWGAALLAAPQAAFALSISSVIAVIAGIAVIVMFITFVVHRPK